MNTIQPSLQRQIIQWVLLFLFSTGLEVSAAKEIILSPSGRNSTDVIENIHSRLQVSNTISSFNVLILNTEKGEFVEILINSYSKTNTIGSPQLPVVSKLIEIPYGSIPETKVISYELKEYKLSDLGITQKLFPVQEPQPKNTDQNKPVVLNKQVYETNGFYVEELARVEVAGYLRGVQLANLIFSPVEYNPVTNTIKVYEKLVVEVNFHGASKLKTIEHKTKTKSPYFNNVFSNLLNYQLTDANPEVATSVPVKYIIVSDPMFRDALQPFVKWKTKRGFRVIEAYTNDPAVGTTNSSIKAYLQNLYTSATSTDPAPTFVLFVGDVPMIPAFDCGDHVSDLYYCEYTGDYLPEVFYGRFSANTIAELLPQINKTLQYEQYLMPDPTFLNEVVLAAGADETHQERWGNGQVNYGTTYYFNAAHNIEPHVYLQPEPAGSSYSKNVQANISKGVAYANYSAHGNPEGWSDPSFTISDIANLKNSGKYCLMVGNSCQTNAYDQNSFGEALVRAENKGALGYIGASGLSYWDEDYWWGVGNGSIVSNPTLENTGPGAYDLVFHEHGEPRSQWCSTMGQMILAGNLAVQESNSGMKKHYWEIYCLMGDPSTMIYFGVPSALEVFFNPQIPLGISAFEVRTEPFASIAISKNNILHGVAEANENGLAVVSLQPFAEPGYADIVVTMQNRQPFIDSISVISPEGPYLVLNEVMINDSDGNHNSFPEPGEPLSVDIFLDNIGYSDAIQSNSILSTSDNFFTIQDDSCFWPSIAGNGSASAENAFTLHVSDHIPDMHRAYFSIKTQTGSETFTSEFNFLVYAPKLITGITEFDDTKGGNGNGMIDPGETIAVTVLTTNAGHCMSGDVSTQMFLFGGSLSSDSKAHSLGKLAPGETGTSTFTFTVDRDAIAGSHFSLYIAATAGPYNSVSGSHPVIGPQIEDFESGNLLKYNWRFKGDTPWECSSFNVSEGLFSTRSGTVNNSGRSEMYLEGQVLFNDTISFYRKVSCESGYDFLKFYVDGSEVGRWSGNSDWLKVSYPVSAGNHRFSWIYEKDEANAAGLDAGWIDYIRLPSLSHEPAGPLSVKVLAVPATICAGEQSQLYAFASGGTGEYKYTWTPANQLRDTGVLNPDISPKQNTTYSVTVTSGLDSATADVPVNVEQQPATPVIMVSGDHLVSSSTSGNQWYNTEGLIPGATAQEYFPSTTETYFVTVNAKGCPSDTSAKVTFRYTGIECFGETGFSVYPNPFTGILFIEFTTKLPGWVKIVLYNSAGKEIRTVEDENIAAGNHEVSVDGSQLAAGIYVCKIFSGDAMQITKVVKIE